MSSTSASFLPCSFAVRARRGCARPPCGVLTAGLRPRNSCLWAASARPVRTARSSQASAILSICAISRSYTPESWKPFSAFSQSPALYGPEAPR
jgi:hypothetical protein